MGRKAEISRESRLMSPSFYYVSIVSVCAGMCALTRSRKGPPSRRVRTDKRRGLEVFIKLGCDEMRDCCLLARCQRRQASQSCVFVTDVS